MTELKRANVRGYRPTIVRRNSFGVGIHNAIALCDNVEEMANWRLAQPIDVVGRRHRKTALDDHPIALAGAAMTDGTVDFESLAPALESFACDRNRECGHEVCPDFAGVKGFIFIQVS